jgi:hypothetical protein
MYGSEFHGSNYYASLYYGVLRGDTDDLSAFSKLSLHDVQYEALRLVEAGSDARSMEHAYWLRLLGGRGTTGDIKYEGIILGLGHSDYKAYYDSITGTTWPDVNSSEKAYWLQIITENI